MSSKQAPRFYATYVNDCGVCILGPNCLCVSVTDTRPKIIPSGKSQPGLGYRGIAYSSPVAQRMIDEDTAAFRAEMQKIVKLGHKGLEE